MKELDKKFYYKTFRPDRQHSYLVIATMIMEAFAPQSVIDYGCGLGWILYYLKTKFGLTDLMGVEPNPEIQHEMRDEVNEFIHPLSLAHPIVLENRRFDLAVSLEAAEHIEERHADMIVENICRHADQVLFSAAHPGQGGYGHLNEQPKPYWIQKFNAMGFHVDQRTDQFVGFLRKAGTKPWYWQNVIIFERDQ